MYYSYVLGAGFVAQKMLAPAFLSRPVPSVVREGAPQLRIV